jgi:hypothetical protein
LGKGHGGIFINFVLEKQIDSPDSSKCHVHLFWCSFDKKAFKH